MGHSMLNVVEQSKIVSPARPLPVTRAVLKLGRDVRDARRRRRISTAILAQRASISRTTLSKLEKGNIGVSIGIYASVLMCLGMMDRLADLADPRHDAMGVAVTDEQIPVRIRLPRRKD